MAIESGLAQQASTFTDSLYVKPAPSVEKTADETGQEAKIPQQGDTVNISAEARALAAVEETAQDNPFGLTEEESERAEKLFGELDALFASGDDLTAEQEARAEEIFKELDELFPVEDEFQLTADEEKQLDALFEQLDALYANEELTEAQEKTAGELEGRIDAIFMGAAQREDGGEEVKLGIPENQTEESEADPITEQTINRLKEQIEELEEEIKELEDGDLPEKEKNQQVQAKQSQLMELRDQLLKAQQEELEAQGMAEGGGTRATGFGNSVSNF